LVYYPFNLDIRYYVAGRGIELGAESARVEGGAYGARDPETWT